MENRNANNMNSGNIKNNENQENDYIPYSTIPRIEEQYRDISFDKLKPQ